MFSNLISRLYRKLDAMGVDGRRYTEFPVWERRKDVVLMKDTEVEIGKRRSEMLVMWSHGKGDESRVYVQDGISDSIAVIVISRVTEIDDYTAYRDIRSRFYGINLKGVTLRVLPGRVWIRIGKEAVRDGFNLGTFGRAVVEEINSLPFVSSTDVVMLREYDELKELFTEARKITGALVKMHEESLFECESCEYKDVCSEIPELKRLRLRKLENEA